MGIDSKDKNLNLAIVVMHGTYVYLRHEWKCSNKCWASLLVGTAGEEIHIGCRMINGSRHEKATNHSNQ